MGLFSKNNKNANEAAYLGGKKHWTDVIKNSGSGDVIPGFAPLRFDIEIVDAP